MNLIGYQRNSRLDNPFIVLKIEKLANILLFKRVDEIFEFNLFYRDNRKMIFVKKNKSQWQCYSLTNLVSYSLSQHLETID